MPYIEVERGIRIFVEDINPNAARTILLIHGWPADHNMFEYQFNVLPAHGFRCISMDIRGFGKSDRPWQGYSYNRLADDVRAVIDTLKLKDITLLGFSVGGAIAVTYMSRHFGHGVANLVLAGAAVPIFTKRPDYPYGLPVADINKIIAQTYTDRPKMIDEFSEKFFASKVSPQFINWFSDLALAASGHATIRILESLRDEDLRNDLSWITVPTCILHGVHDQVVPFANAEITHQCIRCSTLIPFEYSGHGLFYDELEKFNSCLLGFLEQTC